MVEDAKRASDTRIATGNRLTLRMILPTVGNAAKCAVSVRLAMVENAKRALEEHIAMENGLTHLGIHGTAVNAGLPAPRA